MKRLVTLFAVLGVLACGAGLAQAQPNLLTNPSVDDPDVHEGVTATGWTLETFKTLTGPSDTANFANFGDRTGAPGRGLWYRGFVGNATTGDYAQANLTQSRPGTPGTKYGLSAWSRFEANWPGGVAGDITDTILAIDFLGAGNAVLSTSALELAAAGQTNDGVWRQFNVSGTAPAGTLNVRARASMVNGHSVTLNPQSAFMDDFSLRVVPEPATLMVGLIGMASLMGLVRRR